MEWLWILTLAVILFGPVVFVLIRGRRWSAPKREDELGSTGYGALLRDKEDIGSLGSR